MGELVRNRTVWPVVSMRALLEQCREHANCPVAGLAEAVPRPPRCSLSEGTALRPRVKRAWTVSVTGLTSSASPTVATKSAESSVSRLMPSA